MFQQNTKVIGALLSLIVSFSSHAATICAISCPTNSDGSPDLSLPQITEISSLDGSDLFLENTGLIILDVNIYNNLSNFTIDPSSQIYIGLSSLPASLALPDTLQLFSVQYTGGLTLTGGAIDYVLLRDYSGDTQLNISATDGVLVMDTNALTAVPAPNAIVLLISGLTFLSAYGRRKKQF
jgi:hypothetical protein